MKNNFSIYKLAGMLTVVTVMANCGNFATTIDSGNKALESKEALPPVGLLTADQMLKGMISVTGTEGLGELTDPADDLINATFNERSGSLPSEQGLNQVTGPTLISAANLASTVCAKAVDRDRAVSQAQANDRLFFREVDFSRGLAGQNSESVLQAFSRLARNAWRRDVTATENDTILSFAQEFSTGVDGNDSAQTRMLAVSVCTAVLASMDGLTY